MIHLLTLSLAHPEKRHILIFEKGVSEYIDYTVYNMNIGGLGNNTKRNIVLFI